MTPLDRFGAPVSIACLVLLAGCVQMPTEHQGAVDLRPHIGFNVAPNIGVSNARVLIDGLDAGPLSHYQNGAGTLRLLPGTHVVQVRDDTRLLFDDKVFLADGANRTLNLTGTQPR